MAKSFKMQKTWINLIVVILVKPEGIKLKP